MFSQYFGQYLLNQGILTASELYEAIELERSTKAKLGVLALQAGLMTAEQIEEVHNLQRTMDRRFGEIAISKGYISEKQVNALLNEQQGSCLALSQVVVEKGFLTLSQLEVALEGYTKGNGSSMEQLCALKKADMDGIIRSSLTLSVDPVINELYYEYVSLFLRNIIRLLNDTPILISTQAKSLDEGEAIPEWLVTQNIAGEANLMTGLAMEDTTFLELARQFSAENLDSIDPLAKDSVMEFLNVHNGIFLVNASDKGKRLDLTAPDIMKNVKVVVHNGYRIPIQVSFGQIDIIIGQKDIQ